MIDKPHLTEFAAQQTAVIRFIIPRSEIQNVMGPGLTELMTVLAEQEITPAGAWFSHHFKMDPETFDFELGLPVKIPVTPTGRVVRSELPARKVARTIYHGGYEGLGNAWFQFMAWIHAEGLATKEDLWECYVTGPESSADPLKWRTELNRPLG